MHFDFITVVHINGLGSVGLSDQYAIQKSVEQLPGAKGLLLSPVKPLKVLDGVTHIEIPRVERQDYSFFVVYALHMYINTPFVLIVQEDGWVLNGTAWSDDFLSYDYLGAPTHLAKVNYQTYKSFNWTPFLDNSGSAIYNVFNGGFSLRSKRFLEAPAKYKIPYIIQAPIGLGFFPNLLLWEDESNKEDVQICLYMRQHLERLGLKFPPLEIAKYFSFEHLTPKLHDGINLQKVFGHHSSRRKLQKDNHIQYSETYNDVLSIYGETRVLDLFSALNYTLSFA